MADVLQAGRNGTFQLLIAHINAEGVTDKSKRLSGSFHLTQIPLPRSGGPHPTESVDGHSYNGRDFGHRQLIRDFLAVRIPLFVH